jgi:hypothetical protein
MRRKLQNAQIETRAVHTQQSTHKKNKGKSTNNAAATNKKSTDTRTHTHYASKNTLSLQHGRQQRKQQQHKQQSERGGGMGW